MDVIPCPFCGVLEQESVASENGYQLARCGACRLLFVSLSPSPERIDEADRTRVMGIEPCVPKQRSAVERALDVRNCSIGSLMLVTRNGADIQPRTMARKWSVSRAFRACAEIRVGPMGLA